MPPTPSLGWEARHAAGTEGTSRTKSRGRSLGAEATLLRLRFITLNRVLMFEEVPDVPVRVIF